LSTRGQVDSRSSPGKDQCPVLQTPLQLDYCSSRTGERRFPSHLAIHSRPSPTSGYPSIAPLKRAKLPRFQQVFGHAHFPFGTFRYSGQGASLFSHHVSYILHPGSCIMCLCMKAHQRYSLLLPYPFALSRSTLPLYRLSPM